MTSNLPPDQGRVRVIVVEDPPVGTDFTVVMPALVRWELKMLTGRLNCDANVAFRIPRVEIVDGNLIIGTFGSDFRLQATETLQYTWGQGVSIAVVSSAPTAHGPLPVGLRLVNRMIIRHETAGIQAGDQWRDISLLVEEWIDETDGT